MGPFPSRRSRRRRGYGNAPEQAGSEVGQPERAKPVAHFVATGSGPLADDTICCGIDLGQGETFQRGPDGVGAGADVAAVPRKAGDDGGHHATGALVHSRDGPIALIERPDGAERGREEARMRSDGDRCEDRS